MIVTWDHAKRLANFDKHGLDFADLDVDFFLNSLVVPAQKGRLKAVGLQGDERLIVVAFAPLGTEAVSIISMRPASTKERSLFDER